MCRSFIHIFASHTHGVARLMLSASGSRLGASTLHTLQAGGRRIVTLSAHHQNKRLSPPHQLALNPIFGGFFGYPMFSDECANEDLATYPSSIYGVRNPRSSGSVGGAISNTFRPNTGISIEPISPMHGSSSEQRCPVEKNSALCLWPA